MTFSKSVVGIGISLWPQEHPSVTRKSLCTYSVLLIMSQYAQTVKATPLPPPLHPTRITPSMWACMLPFAVASHLACLLPACLPACCLHLLSRPPLRRCRWRGGGVAAGAAVSAQTPSLSPAHKPRLSSSLLPWKEREGRRGGARERHTSTPG